MGYFDTLKNLEGIRQRENQNALARQAGGMLSQGDQTGARNALWRGGELDAGFKIEEGMSSSRKAQAEAMERFTTGVSRMLDDPSYANDPNGADRAWNDATGFASQLGLNPDALNQDRDAFLKNPKGWAAFWNQKAKEEAGYTLSPGSKRFGPDNKMVAEAPFAPQLRTLGEGQTLVEVGSDNGNPIPGGMPRNQRNANPGNIEDGPFARSLPGYAGSDGRFARFNDPNAGQNAQLALLDSYAKRGLNTVAGIINRWAPPSENDTAAYARFVAGKLGVSPDQPLDMNNPQVKQALAAAITTFEGGPGSGGGSSAAGGARVVAQGAPKQREKWVDLPTGGQVNTVTGEKKNVGGADKITDGARQGASLTFATIAGNERMNDLARRGVYKPTSPIESIIKPDANGFIRIVARNPTDRQFVQAATEFLAPILRKDTGAAVTYQEFMFYKDMLIPAFEDDKRLLWQKAQARDAQIRRIYGASRRAYDQEYGAPGKWSVLTDPSAKPGAKAAAPRGPKPGTVEDGYRFKGGDPKNPKSWEKL